MSKKLLIATLTAFSITALSGTAGASTPSYDASPIVLEQNSLPGTSEFRFQDEGLPQARRTIFVRHRPAFSSSACSRS